MGGGRRQKVTGAAAWDWRQMKERRLREPGMAGEDGGGGGARRRRDRRTPSTGDTIETDTGQEGEELR